MSRPALIGALSVALRSGRYICRLTVPEMEERKLLGLCYNCDEKFYHFHTYQNLFLMEIDYGLDNNEHPTDPEPQISLLVLVGVRTSKTM